MAEHAVIGLFVLPPGDAADEALVVQVDALAAEHGVAQRMVVAQQGLVDLAAIGVGDHRVVALAVARAVVAGIADAADVVGFDEAGEAVPLAALEADTGADGLGVGVVQGVVLVDVFVAVAQVEDRRAVPEQVAEVFTGPGAAGAGEQGKGDWRHADFHGDASSDEFCGHVSGAAIELIDDHQDGKKSCRRAVTGRLGGLPLKRASWFRVGRGGGILTCSNFAVMRRAYPCACPCRRWGEREHRWTLNSCWPITASGPGRSRPGIRSSLRAWRGSSARSFSGSAARTAACRPTRWSV
ncbi:hypothetical protein FQZ97_867410 [compost metagenome]